MWKKYCILCLATVFIQLNLWSQNNFYAVDSLREIRIYFYMPDWDYQLDSLYVFGDNDRILADIEIDGNYYDSVGVGYKGFSSVSVNRLKNPFNIKLDYIIEGQDHQGVAGRRVHRDTNRTHGAGGSLGVQRQRVVQWLGGRHQPGLGVDKKRPANILAR